jgi:trimethylamine:corrinoid methyltransferase-like protein
MVNAEFWSLWLLAVFPVEKLSFKLCEGQTLMRLTRARTRSAAMRKEGALDSIEMASAIVGGLEELRKKPIMLLRISITSPLTYDRPLKLSWRLANSAFQCL